MKTPCNNIDVFVPNCVPHPNVQPILVYTDNGSPVYVNTEVDNFDSIDPANYSVGNLLKAGINLESLSISTSPVNSVSDISSTLNTIQSLSFNN